MNKQTYFILDRPRNRVKIGSSSVPVSRLAALRTGNPDVELLLVINANMERSLHHRFARYRISHEWFEWSQEIEGFVQQTPNDQPNPPLKILNSESFASWLLNHNPKLGVLAGELMVVGKAATQGTPIHDLANDLRAGSRFIEWLNAGPDWKQTPRGVLYFLRTHTHAFGLWNEATKERPHPRFTPRRELGSTVYLSVVGEAYAKYITGISSRMRRKVTKRAFLEESRLTRTEARIEFNQVRSAKSLAQLESLTA